MTRHLAVIALTTIPFFPAAAAESGRSAALTHTLTEALTAKGMDAIAANYPNQPDRFVAALYFPGAQLLVVSARYAAPEAMQGRLQRHEFRDVYLDLQGSSDRDSRWFLQDMSADGLCAGRNQVADILYERADVTTVFDGDWRKHELPEDRYLSLRSTAEQEYCRLLEVLIAQVGRS